MVQDLALEEVLRNSPYLSKMAKYVIFTTKDDISELRRGPKVKIDAGKFNYGDVSIELLKRIVNNETYYEHVYNVFTDDVRNFMVCYISHGDIDGIIKCSKAQIVKGIESLIASDTMILDSEEQKRYDSLKQLVSYEQFLEKNKGSSYGIKIDGKEYSIPIEQIFSLMFLQEEDFDKLCCSSEIKSIYGIPKEYFIYAVSKYFKDGSIFNDIVFPEVVAERFDDIVSMQKIDIQAINVCVETTDTKFKEARINEDLENLILNGMPEDASNLEKAIYIYIKMCKALTYDDEYYAVGQAGSVALRHRNINHVSTITPQNNKAVCFEFNLIYAKLLNDLGIKFVSDYKSFIGEAYGDGHANLNFRCGKFLVRADAVASILEGDMVQAKLNKPLTGLECLNVNDETKNQFQQSASRMYQLIVKQEKDKMGFQHMPAFEELMTEYSFMTDNIKDVDLEDKLEILVSKVNSADLVGIDSLSYVLQLRKVLFADEERNNNIKVSIIRNNEPIDQDRIAMASAIITVNEDGFEDYPEKNKYFCFNPNFQLMELSKDEVQTRFNEGTFEYIYAKDPKIPGITVGGVKDDRKTTTY